jgi:hypothetical protein
MIYTIPIDVTHPAIVQETALDGVTYRFTFRWNARDGYWYMGLSTIEDVAILPTRRLVPGARLLRYMSGSVRPPGELMLLGTPTRTTLGTEAQLVYLDADEVASL